jgi:hypothetical protein
MPNYQLNILFNSPRPNGDTEHGAALKAVQELGAVQVVDSSIITLSQEIEVQIVDTKAQTVRTETVRANDLDEAKEILDVGPHEFVASAPPPEEPEFAESREAQAKADAAPKEATP